MFYFKFISNINLFILDFFVISMCISVNFMLALFAPAGVPVAWPRRARREASGVPGADRGVFGVPFAPRYPRWVDVGTCVPQVLGTVRSHGSGDAYRAGSGCCTTLDHSGPFWAILDRLSATALLGSFGERRAARRPPPV